MGASIIEIESQLRHIRDLCLAEANLLEDRDEKALVTATAEVLGGLEKAFQTCFHDHSESHIFSPKSLEPWD